MSDSKVLHESIQSEVTGLANSVSMIVNKFKELQVPLTESKEKVPVATQQLDKISEQTEAATHQMLDTIEHMQVREEKVIDGLGKVRDQAKSLPDVELLVAGLEDMANANLNDSYIIMDALQFQDITSQQMNHAASLLEEIEAKLQNIVSVMTGNSGLKSEKDPQKVRVFDPNADLLSSKTDQETIDDLFSGQKS